MKQLYIIAGPNGAGKTTASYVVLPDIFHCSEFINADEIARGLSPFNPEAVAIKSGRLMLERIQVLLKQQESFSIETTLATKSYTRLIKKAQGQGYKVTLLFLYLKSDELAQERVRIRVEEGGHYIPTETIKRRFKSGLCNFFTLYMSLVDNWIIIDNSKEHPQDIAEGQFDKVLQIKDTQKWQELKETYHDS